MVPDGCTTLEIYANCATSGASGVYTAVVDGINNELSCSNSDIGCNKLSVSGGQEVIIYSGGSTSTNIWGIYIY